MDHLVLFTFVVGLFFDQVWYIVTTAVPITCVFVFIVVSIYVHLHCEENSKREAYGFQKYSTFEVYVLKQTWDKKG